MQGARQTGRHEHDSRAEPDGWRAHALKIAEAATTPLVPADFLDLFAPLRAGAELRGRMESVHPETADAATLVIRPGADWAGHVPGQYVRSASTSTACATGAPTP